MSVLALFNHLINFAAPAFFVALVLALCGRWILPKRAGAPAFWMQLLVNFGAGLLVLSAGLWVFGHDARMFTYVALVLACGTEQWWLGRGRRR